MSIPVLKHKRATLERIEKYISDTYFTRVNLYGRVDTYIPVRCQLFRVNLCKPSSAAFQLIKSKTGTFSQINQGESFVPLWSQHWIKLVIPPDIWAKENLYLHWDVDGAESLVCSEDGSPLQGLSCKRKEFKINKTTEMDSSENLVYFIEVSCTGLFGAGNNGMINPPNESKKYTLNKAAFFTRDEDKYNVFMDLSVLYEIAKECSSDSSLAYDALYSANNIINHITLNDHSSQSYSGAVAMGKAFFKKEENNGSRDTIHAIGNCHIDSAWLWPYRESIRKVARSWSSTVSMFEAGLDFKFAGSQMVQIDWLRTHYPQLFAMVNKHIYQKNFIPVGGTWVEMDTNIPSSESLIRQFLYGQGLLDTLNVQSNILWLPDTFGYSGQLPQIMKICGIDYFLSQKLSWNLTNTFPHHTFHWKGIDQSRVLAHFPPGDTYESSVKVKDVLKSVSNNKDKGRTHDQMLLFGHGDGGGGPTPEMIHRLDRLRSVKGMPRIINSTPQKFFESLEKSSNMLCEWWGELYFELHRGTYTTHAKLKESNRIAEFWMTDIEFLSSLDKDRLLCSTKIDEMWKIVLFNQFHDILPGSAIEQVFIDAMEDYTRLLKLYTEEWEIVKGSVAASCQHFVVNPYNWNRRQIIQVNDEGTKEALVDIPGLYIGPVAVTIPSDKAGVFVLDDGICLCNSVVKAVFSMTGHLRSVIHKSTKRECLADGRFGNSFVIFDDVPLFWDAWDVMEYHVETRQEFHPTSIEVEDQGPLRASVKIIVPLGDHGDITVLASVHAECPFVSFKAEVNWSAAHKFLKVEFPLSVTAMEAQYEIQSGFVSRPTHSNTSWDSAKFEVSGHKWAHLGEPNFGVCLLSRSKYGYSASHNTLTLSLLRSPKAPDLNADMGHHTIEYAVYPHSGPLSSSRAVQHAINFNHPLTLNKLSEEFTPVTDTSLSNLSALRIDGEEVIIQAIKKPEEGRGLIVRMYEPYGNTVVGVNIAHPLVVEAFSINAVEKDSTKVPIAITDGVVGPIKFRPFEIKTILLLFENDKIGNSLHFSKKARLEI